MGFVGLLIPVLWLSGLILLLLTLFPGCLPRLWGGLGRGVRFGVWV